MGIVCPLASIGCSHSKRPDFDSKAQRLSFVAPINTSPPAVAMLPPRLRAPVFLTPWASEQNRSERTPPCDVAGAGINGYQFSKWRL